MNLIISLPVSREDGNYEKYSENVFPSSRQKILRLY